MIKSLVSPLSISADSQVQIQVKATQPNASEARHIFVKVRQREKMATTISFVHTNVEKHNQKGQDAAHSIDITSHKQEFSASKNEINNGDLFNYSMPVGGCNIMKLAVFGLLIGCRCRITNVV